MKDVTDLVTWIMGILATVVLFGWRYDKNKTDKRLDVIIDRQRDGATRLSVAETKISSIQEHYMQTLEDIKIQQSDMAKDVTAIKIAVASLPKRRED
ncbi:hypothetical protein JKY79_03020 [Candidatus Babeliales bacterium]|nr:hypothetical protein [Candidatus Babeliales bacterium]